LRGVPRRAGHVSGRLETYFAKTLGLTADERQTLLAGQPLAKMLEADPSKEVAVFGAIWIAAPPSKYVAALKAIEDFEKGGNFIVTKRISEPARSRTSPPSTARRRPGRPAIVRGGRLRAETGGGSAGAGQERGQLEGARREEPG
jgi:hypothetical protein